MNLPDPSPVLETLQRIPSGTWVTAGGAGMVAFLAGLAFARGVVRQLVGMVCLGLSITVAFYVYRHRAEVFGTMGTTMTTDRLMMFSAGAGLLTYFICKGVIHLLAGFGILNLLGGLAGWKGLMLSVIPSGFLLWAGSMALRLTGNVAGVESAAEMKQQGENLQSKFTAFLHQLSQQVDRSSLGSLAEKLDPFDMRATANLARLLILWPDGTVWNQLALQSPRTALTLNHPRLIALGADPKVRQAIDRQDFAGLMQLQQVEEAAADPDLNHFLTGLALEEAMDTIVYKQPAKQQQQQPPQFQTPPPQVAQDPYASPYSTQPQPPQQPYPGPQPPTAPRQTKAKSKSKSAAPAPPRGYTVQGGANPYAAPPGQYPGQYPAQAAPPPAGYIAPPGQYTPQGYSYSPPSVTPPPQFQYTPQTPAPGR